MILRSLLSFISLALFIYLVKVFSVLCLFTHRLGTILYSCFWLIFFFSSLFSISYILASLFPLLVCLSFPRSIVQQVSLVLSIVSSLSLSLPYLPNLCLSIFCYCIHYFSIIIFFYTWPIKKSWTIHSISPASPSKSSATCRHATSSTAC